MVVAAIELSFQALVPVLSDMSIRIDKIKPLTNPCLWSDQVHYLISTCLYTTHKEAWSEQRHFIIQRIRRPFSCLLIAEYRFKVVSAVAADVKRKCLVVEAVAGEGDEIGEDNVHDNTGTWGMVVIILIDN